MPITIRITKTLEDWWATEEQFASMNDEEILELVREDISAVSDDAKFEVIRSDVTQTSETLETIARLEIRNAELQTLIHHGFDCEKVPHIGSGYLHGEADDRRYDVDGCWYCGRCHLAL